MKRTLSILTAVMLALALCITTCAEDVSVYVTISDDNAPLAVKYEKIAVSDFDGDGVVTVNDALFAAHEEFYKGGAKEGYEAVKSEYGLSLNKLWGTVNGGSYGYYINNQSSASLLDTVSDGDHLYAYAYTDLISWSDTYSYFDLLTSSCEEGGNVTLTLLAATYDENWNPITVPVVGANITLNGKDTGIITDENGTATITCNKAGEHIISAVSETETLVPPICTLTVIGTAPKIGAAAVVGLGVIVLLSVAVFISYSALKRKNNEK